MTYIWSDGLMGAVFALPTAVADRELKLAGEFQLKVLLWFARQGGGEFDAAACAKAVGSTPAECLDAMTYWTKERGLLKASGEKTPARPTEAPEAPAPEKAVPEEAVPEEAAPEEELPPPPAPKRPQMPQVLAKQKASATFAHLLKEAEKRLGRPVTHREMETFLYIYDGLGLPAEVILMLLVDAVRRGKSRTVSGFASYLEKAALSWAESGITTVAAAEQELCRRERRDQVREHLRTLFALDRTPTLLQVDNAVLWLDEWHFSDEVLTVAKDYAVEKTGKPSLTYIHRVLEGWYADGITSPAGAKEALSPRKKSAGSPLLYDKAAEPETLDEQEPTATGRRLKYKKKSK